MKICLKLILTSFTCGFSDSQLGETSYRILFQGTRKGANGWEIENHLRNKAQSSTHLIAMNPQMLAKIIQS